MQLVESSIFICKHNGTDIHSVVLRGLCFALSHSRPAIAVLTETIRLWSYVIRERDAEVHSCADAVTIGVRWIHWRSTLNSVAIIHAENVVPKNVALLLGSKRTGCWILSSGIFSSQEALAS